jgi:hypothetical protein
MNWTVLLRVVQIACVLLLLECIRLSRSLRHEWNGTTGLVHWPLIVGGVWSGILRFHCSAKDRQQA